ncbi:helix-turn-helix domain-containing protein [Actinocorallia longicatena]|uniref:PucR family transcriptional regulator n=1 Tax=Actinocorallia longicatena TaxID=111803 RepID=A0ABP6QLV9_9ACTN
MTPPPFDARPFEAIPFRLARHLRIDLVRVGEEIVKELHQAETEWADPAVGARVREGVMGGLNHFAELAEDPHGGWARLSPGYVEMGKRLAREGRSPDEVHHALRQAGRAMWRSVKDVLDTLDIDRKTIGLLADAQFSYMDAVTAAVRFGHESEGEASPEVLARRRASLLSLLLAEPRPDRESVAGAADKARWTVPGTVAAAVLSPRDRSQQTPRLLPDGLLVDWGRNQPCVLIPDPEGPGRASLLKPLLREWIVVVGMPVPVERAAESHRWARETLALVERGVIDGDRLVHCADHVTTLVMFGAKNLLDAMATTRLAPLDGLPLVQRERLTETLLSLLSHNFNATEAGRRMHVHPQTVRYRFRQLEKLFGPDLSDPQRCLEIEMILRTRHALGRAG